jgi:hypothetical protein
MTARLKRTPRRATVATIALALLAGFAGAFGASGAAGSSSTTGASPPPGTLAPIHPHGQYAPEIDPANFVGKVDNRYWPLKPGTAYHYRGVRGKTRQQDHEAVTRDTKQILGIESTVVRDTVSEHGHPVERTFDWYAQDKWGNVWYMGEDSLELQHGHFVKASDSWQSGVDGAQPGIIMPANPRPGDAYRQEYYPPGEALDQARVLALDGSVKVPYGSFHRLLVTSERSPLEPQTEQKYYAPGLGEVSEVVVKGHHEEFKLVRVTH